MKNTVFTAKDGSFYSNAEGCRFANLYYNKDTSPEVLEEAMKDVTKVEFNKTSNIVSKEQKFRQKLIELSSREKLEVEKFRKKLIESYSQH